MSHNIKAMLFYVFAYEVVAFVYNNYVTTSLDKTLPFDGLTGLATNLGITIPAYPGQWQ